MKPHALRPQEHFLTPKAIARIEQYIHKYLFLNNFL